MTAGSKNAPDVGLGGSSGAPNSSADGQQSIDGGALGEPGIIDEPPMAESDGGKSQPEEPFPGGSLTSAAACDTFDYGALIVEPDDANCGTYTPDACDSGTHIALSPNSACAQCIPNAEAERSCEWADACFPAFLQRIAHSSGAKACTSDDDCSLMTLGPGCAANVTIALSGFINEEISYITELWAEQNCVPLCGDSLPTLQSHQNAMVICEAGVCIQGERL